MAKSNEDGSVVNETLATDTLANLFADENDRVIIHAGPQNDSGKGETAVVDGFTVPMLIPREFAQYAKELETMVSINWHGDRAKGTTVGEKVASLEEYIATQWEPKEATLRSPIEQAAYDRLLVRNLEAGKIKPNASEKEKDRVLNPGVATLLNSPAMTETGRPVIDAYLNKLRDYDNNMIKRGRKGVETATAASEPADLVVSF